MRVCGHRGAAGLAPENTLVAVQRALDLGVDLVECDVHASADGRVMVIHDPTLERTTNGAGRVERHPFEALRKLDAGGGERIPELREVIDLVKGRAELVCEFKTPAVVEAAVACVRGAGLLDDTTFIDFDWRNLDTLKRIEPKARFAALLWNVDDVLLAEALAVGSGIDMHYKRVSLAVSEMVHKAGRFLWVYTPNSPESQRLMHELGVDAITTDRPDLALAAP
ncbi:MAG: hypothetical protein RLZZ303_2602 [Candidatus Hydrogenedentota bacterium]